MAFSDLSGDMISGGSLAGYFDPMFLPSAECPVNLTEYDCGAAVWGFWLEKRRALPIYRPDPCEDHHARVPAARRSRQANGDSTVWKR